jgi:hypothetical protein
LAPAKVAERTTVAEADGLGVGAGGCGVEGALGEDPPPPHAAVRAATNANPSFLAIASSSGNASLFPAR